MIFADVNDVSLIPTSKVTHTLMAALQNSPPNAKGFIISGYPRNMRDVADYLEKVSASGFPVRSKCGIKLNDVV